MTVVCREYIQLDSYRRLYRTVTFRARSYFQPEGASLLYFRLNEFEYKTVAKSDVVEIIE